MDTETIGTRDGGAFVLSLERDRRAIGLASSHIRCMTDHGIGDEGAQEASKLRTNSDGKSIERYEYLMNNDIILLTIYCSQHSKRL